MAVDAARAQALFQAATNLPDAAARAVFLDRECGNDVELREQIEALLRGDATGALVSEPHRPASVATGFHHPHGPTDTFHDAATLRERTAATELGTVIAGRYTLVEVIGEGGMGSVYLATQTEPVKRQVALKLIKTGMDSRTVLARFDAERQALALMDHPNIARVYDGGTTATGQPYFVMELVNGVPLTTYCDAKRLSVKARLELFVAVCQAVQHAHQKGIIHRDLKPGNVLVTEVDGRATPKVIDFGVAKATEQKLTDQSFSDTGAIVGTPAYMSPEQADPSSMDIDTRTDVYALGVMLYELLAGSPPIDSRQFKRGAILEMLRMVREVEPPRPSTKLSTADALPNIAANRSIEPAKLTKLLRGELDWVVMKALEKDRTRRYDSANGLGRDIQRYLADELVEARPPSRGYRLRKFIKRNKVEVVAASLVLLVLIAGIAGTGFGLIRAERALIAEAERAAGERAATIEADKQRIAAVDAANAERLASDNAKKRLTQVEKANDVLGSIFQDLDIEQMRAEGSRLELILGEQLKKATAGLRGDTIGDPLVVAKLQFTLGKSLYSLSYYPEAIELFKLSHQARARILGPDDRETLVSLDALASAYQYNDQIDLAIPLFEESLERNKRIFGPDHPETLATMSNLGDAYRVAARYDQAVAFLTEALRICQAKLGADSKVTSNTMNQLAVCYQLQRKFELAMPLYEGALEYRRRVMGADHPITLTSINNLAACYKELGRGAKAEELFEEVVRIRKDKLGPTHHNTLISMNNLALTYQANGKLDEAVALFEETWSLMKTRLGDANASTLNTLNNLAVAHQAAEHSDRAAELFRINAELIKQKFGPDSIQYAGLLVQEGYNLLLSEKWAEAETPLRLSLALRQKLQPDSWGTFNTQSLLGGSLLGQKKYAAADPLLLKGYEGMKQREKMIPPQGNTRIPEALDRLITLYTLVDRPDEVKKYRAERAKYPPPAAPRPREKK